MQIRHVRTASVAVALVATGAVLSTGIGWAAGSGGFKACASRHGTLSLLKHGHCQGTSKPVTLGKRGPRGPKGRPGTGWLYDGIPGGQGEAPSKTLQALPQRLAIVRVPAGTYFVQARVDLLADDPMTNSSADCSLYVNYDGSLTGFIDQQQIATPPNTTMPLVLTGDVLYTKPGYAVLGCSGYGTADTERIDAIQVGGRTEEPAVPPS